METGRHTPAPTHRPRRRRKKLKPLGLVIVTDILLAGLFLCIFSTFHHVIPRMQARSNAVKTTPVPVVSAAPAPTETVQPERTAVPEESAEPEPPDDRTEWQKKFAEHFTDEIVRTENSYSSPNISVEITTHDILDDNGRTSVYYVADIYVASLDCFKTYTAHNDFVYMDTESMVDMDAATDAIVSISGDYLTLQYSGFLMRNGNLYDQNYTYCDICVLYSDGTMETYGANSYVIEDILARDPVQIWNFGPMLLDADGAVMDSYNVNLTVSYPNPRSAVGYYEPGHYCFVIVDGRQDGYSYGLNIPQLASIFAELGCTSAYNLDGGGSAVMMFEHEMYSRQSNGGRDLGDILYVAEPKEG